MGKSTNSDPIFIENLIIRYTSEEDKSAEDIDYSKLAEYIFERKDELSPIYQEVFKDKNQEFFEDYTKKAHQRMVAIDNSENATIYFYSAKEVVDAIKDLGELKTDFDKAWSATVLVSGGFFNYWLTYAEWENYLRLDPLFLKDYLENEDLAKLRGQGVNALAEMDSRRTAELVAEEIKPYFEKILDHFANQPRDNTPATESDHSEYIKQLEDQVSKSESELEGHKSKISELESELENHKSKISGLETKLREVPEEPEEDNSTIITLWAEPNKIGEGVYAIGDLENVYVIQTSSLGADFKPELKKLESLNVSELKNLARSNGVKKYSKMNRTKLIGALNQHFKQIKL